MLNLAIDRPVCLAARCSEVAWQWHTRFGHLSFQGLKQLSKGHMVRGLPQIDHVEQICDSCMAGKQRRRPFPATSNYRAKNLLDLVHADLCGPITPETPGGKKLFLLAVDDKSRYMWLVLLSSKDQAADAIIRLQVCAEAEAGHKLGTLRTDRGGEFTSRAFGEYCAMEGVQRHLTAPYTPQQKRRGGEKKPNCAGHGAQHAQGHAHARLVLGGGCSHGHLHPQSIADKKPGGDHTV